MHVDPPILPQHRLKHSVYHSYRDTYQVMEWKGEEAEINPEERGWQVVDNRYLAVYTDLPVAPSELLNIVYFGCKKDCTSRKCKCKKYGMPCTVTCSECRGSSCSNSVEADITDDNVDIML